MCGRVQPGFLGPCPKPSCLSEPPPSPGVQALRPSVHLSSVRPSSALMCLFRVCPQASCGRFQPGLVPVSVSAVQGGGDRRVSSQPGGPGCASTQPRSHGDRGRACCWAQAGAGRWVVPCGAAQGYKMGLSRGGHPAASLSRRPAGGNGSPHPGAFMGTGRQMTAGSPASGYLGCLGGPSPSPPTEKGRLARPRGAGGEPDARTAVSVSRSQHPLLGTLTAPGAALPGREAQAQTRAGQPGRGAALTTRPGRPC